MSDTKENKEWSNREIGALWVNVKQGTSEKYLTGHINDEKIIVFRNKFKEENAKAPDFRVYKQADMVDGKPREEKKEENKEEEEEPDLI
jgi:uncharacterized protein (DUF736 family)